MQQHQSQHVGLRAAAVVPPAQPRAVRRLESRPDAQPQSTAGPANDHRQQRGREAHVGTFLRPTAWPTRAEISALRNIAVCGRRPSSIGDKAAVHEIPGNFRNWPFPALCRAPSGEAAFNRSVQASKRCLHMVSATRFGIHLNAVWRLSESFDHRPSGESVLSCLIVPRTIAAFQIKPTRCRGTV